MNCKPGDMAIIVRDAGDQPLAGRVVEVLYQAPTGSHHTLPDGVPHRPSSPGRWICASLGSPFTVGVYICERYIRHESRMYASIPDEALRPLRGEPDNVQETDDELEVA